MVRTGLSVYRSFLCLRVLVCGCPWLALFGRRTEAPCVWAAVAEVVAEHSLRLSLYPLGKQGQCLFDALRMLWRVAKHRCLQSGHGMLMCVASVACVGSLRRASPTQGSNGRREDEWESHLVLQESAVLMNASKRQRFK